MSAPLAIRSTPIAQETAPRMPVVSVEGLKAYYRTDHFGVKRLVRAVDDVTFEVRRDEIYGLAGESGAGKTTLTKTLTGAVRPPLQIVGGTIAFSFLPGTQGLHCAPPPEVSRVRWRHLSYIMQGSMSVLNPVRRVRSSFEDFAFRHMELSRRGFDAAVRAHLARMQLEPNVLVAYPHELSGGMRQRISIALATICRPELIIADEPTTAVDVIVQKDVLAMIRSSQKEMGSSVLLVTHDMGVHAYLSDRLGIMHAGRLVEEGRSDEILARPRHPYTRHLIASLLHIGDDTPRRGLEGSPPNLADPPPGCRFHPRCPLAMDVCRREVPPFTVHGPDHRVACFAVTPEARP